MTASSRYGSFTRFDPTDWGANHSIDTGLVRDVLINNVRHAYDESFQVVAHWTSESTSNVIRPWEREDDEPRYMTSIGPFPYSVRADGSGARLICRLLANLDQAATAVFSVALQPYWAPVGDMEPPNRSTTFTTSSTTLAWLDSADDYLALSAAEAAAAEYVFETYAPDPDTASPTYPGQYYLTRGRVPMVRLDIFAKTSSTGAWPQIAGWYVREYVG